jgi:hypothetical protein
MMTLHRLNAPRADAGSRITTEDCLRRVKIACDDLHDDPLDPAARKALLELLVEEDDPGTILSW